MVTTFDQKLAEMLNAWEVNGWPVGNLILVVIAIFLSVILCGAIGIEREWRGRSAGLRTHLLVGVGSCVIMIISIYGFPALFGEKRDVARLAAQVITGVGFLGAGAIIHRSEGIKGLTTAGTIWIVMAIGVACGSFNFIIAALTSATVLLVLTIFRKIEMGLSKKKMILVITAPADEPVFTQILAISRELECNVKTLANELVTTNGVNSIQYTYLVYFSKHKGNANEFLNRVMKEIHASDIHTLNEQR